MDSEPVIPAPRDDDDDDVAWALSTAAVQWNRGAYSDAVVWLRRAVDAAINAGLPERTKELNLLANLVADRAVNAAAGQPVDAGKSTPPAREESAMVDELLDAVPVAPAVNTPRASFATLSDQIPIDVAGEDEVGAGTPFDDADTDDEDDAPTIPPPSSVLDALQSAPPSSTAPTLDDSEEVTEALSESNGSDPEALVTLDVLAQIEESVLSESSPPPVDVPAAPAGVAVEGAPPEPDADSTAQDGAEPPVVLDGVSLADVRGLEDLPEEAQRALASAARLETLRVDEEVSFFAAALVTRGKVGIMPAIAEMAGGVAVAGDIVFTRGTLDDGIALRVIALDNDTVVASWDADALDAATSDCPWVADELRLVADRFQALAGATLGPLGDRLDDMLRSMVTDRLDVKALSPREVIVATGNIVPGLHVIGAGRVELLEGEQVVDELGPGDILFAEEVMSAGTAKTTARAGATGALLLVAPRAVAHELLVSVPPLLEILAS